MQSSTKEFKLKQLFQAIRGMNDTLPLDITYWQKLESCCRKISSQYSYQEIRFPIVEKTDLFARTIGDVTDIVEKEMYTFLDRNGDSLSLRPEGTACCVRAGIENGLLYNQVQRLWYMGPMFRHERPQKGRYRQFYQLGVEAFGMSGPEVEAEQMLLFWRLLKALGLSESVSLEINTLGSTDCRIKYKEVLVSYFNQNKSSLDEDSKRRLASNPLRILDSKNPEMQDLIAGAPKIIDVLSQDSLDHFNRLQYLLKLSGIPYVNNPTLVRGLDYYCHTVYEWKTDSLGAQGTVCAGGRYDGLVEKLGGKSTPAVGFAMGLERIVLMMQQLSEDKSSPDIYCVLVGDESLAQGILLAERLRDDLPQLVVAMHAKASSFKSQFKMAHQSGAKWAVIIGDDEIKNNTVAIKSLYSDDPQQTMTWDNLCLYIKEKTDD